ncbi:hypothetical protein BGX38DRAFT_1329427 [Terfezia claveryi]|nr:hypothetical protein BGX38DRAFT_1329427 [Terfezia claveryi]
MTSFSTSGNQFFNVTVQLDVGIRLLQRQLHKDSKGGEPRLCHSTCTLMDAGTLGDRLSKIKEWMDEHESKVVTLLIVNEELHMNIGAEAAMP